LIVVAPLAGLSDLESIERLSHLYPDMTPVLLADDHSPAFFRQAMRAGVREVLPTNAPVAEIVGAVGRIRQKRTSRVDRQGAVLAFLSCKGGGGGATFLAINTAYAMATEEHKRVVVIDLNLQWGDAVFFLSDKKPPMTLGDLASEMSRVDAAFLAASLIRPVPNLGVLAAPEDPVRALDIKPEHIDMLIRLARAEFDVVILDTGRALDAVTVRALDYADAIFPVVQLSLPAIRDSRRLLSAFRALEYGDRKVRPLVNRYQKGGDITLEDFESTVGVKAFHTFPNDYDRVAKSINQGVPVVKQAHGSAISRSIREFAHELVATPVREHEGWFNRMLRRG
jgi:pilus assembly protein CpaE